MKTQYHHGDLRQSLIDQAITMLSDSGVEGLSMRALADAVGVSRTAAYHHFKDKNELLCALAEQGFQDWNHHLHALLLEVPQDPQAWFRSFARAYIQFARDHSEQYDLMFGRPIWKKGSPTDSLKTVSSASFHQYVEFVERCQEQGVFYGEVSGQKAAQVTWGTLHGLCRLLNDGVYLDQASLNSMCDAAARMLISD